MSKKKVTYQLVFEQPNVGAIVWDNIRPEDRPHALVAAIQQYYGVKVKLFKKEPLEFKKDGARIYFVLER